MSTSTKTGLPAFTVKRSNIHGNGVFARRKIAAGERIVEYCGEQGCLAGAWPFAILMAGLAFASPYLPFNQILLMAARPGWHALYVVLVLACNFAGDLVWIPRFGLLGAALATSVAVVVSALLVRVFARTRANLAI